MATITATTPLTNGVEVRLATSGLFANFPYGSITLEISTGMQVFYEMVYLVPCCDKDQLPTKDHVIISETVTDLMNRGIGNFDNFDYWIMDELILDQDFSFNQSFVFMQYDAKITTGPDVTIWSDYSKFSNFCDYRWDGFFLTNQNQAWFSNTSFDGAASGLFCANSSFVDLTNCYFRDNTLSASFIEPVSNSVHISGTTFLTPLVSFVDFAPTTTIDLTPLPPFSSNVNYPTPPEYLHLYAENAEFSFGNSVSGDKYDNQFINEDPDSNRATVGLFALNSHVTTNYNLYDLVFYSIFGFNSFVGGAENAFLNTHWGITTRGCSHDFVDNVFTSATLLLYLNFNSGTSTFTNNRFSGGMNKIIGDDNIHDVIYQGNTHGNNASIKVDSCFSPVVLNQGQDGLIIQNNTFSFGNIQLSNCPYARVIGNDFNNTNPAERSFGAGAIFVKNCNGGQIKNNSIINRVNGIQGTGNLNDITISCNSFDDCDYGMYFPANTFVTDQGSTTLGGFENTWDNMPSGSFSIFNANSNPAFDYFRFCGGNCIPGTFNNIFIIPSSFSFANCAILQKSHEVVNKVLKVYPNPSRDYFIVEQKESEEMSVTVFNAFGQIIYQKQVNDNINHFSHDFPSGVYTVLVQSTTGEHNNSTLVVY